MKALWFLLAGAALIVVPWFLLAGEELPRRFDGDHAVVERCLKVLDSVNKASVQGRMEVLERKMTPEAMRRLGERLQSVDKMFNGQSLKEQGRWLPEFSKDAAVAGGANEVHVVILFEGGDGLTAVQFLRDGDDLRFDLYTYTQRREDAAERLLQGFLGS